MNCYSKGKQMLLRAASCGAAVSSSSSADSSGVGVLAAARGNHGAKVQLEDRQELLSDMNSHSINF